MEKEGPLPGDVQGMEIRCPDGPVGRVADVLVDPLTERPRYLIWREAVVVTREVSIPVDYIERIEENGIVLRVGRAAIERLPRFWMADSEGKENDAAGT
ncbi:MAG TPA: hypothetical protein PLJ35_09950 [Anaerolineae bacterium]|nr:hypothetical protein [Anaerolineae bacterium]HOQ99128.1 hypothetical protein [Anaerolineae bacterium]HPL27895.1 hypothetical protein [Anaerolineae bacterium]